MPTENVSLRRSEVTRRLANIFPTLPSDSTGLSIRRRQPPKCREEDSRSAELLCHCDLGCFTAQLVELVGLVARGGAGEGGVGRSGRGRSVMQMAAAIGPP